MYLYSFLILLSIGIDVSGPIFVDMEKHFTNLISITFWRDGFYGSITPKTFTGLENIEVIHISHTYIENIENGSFDNLKNIKGNLQYFTNVQIILSK